MSIIYCNIPFSSINLSLLAYQYPLTVTMYLWIVNTNTHFYIVYTRGNALLYLSVAEPLLWCGT